MYFAKIAVQSFGMVYSSGSCVRRHVITGRTVGIRARSRTRARKSRNDSSNPSIPLLGILFIPGFQCIGVEYTQRCVEQCLLMRGFHDHTRGRTGPLGLKPSAHTQTPTVSGPQAGEIPLRPGSDQIVPSSAAELQEFPGHPGTYHVGTRIVCAGSAITVPVYPCFQAAAAGLQFGAEYILFHTSRKKPPLRMASIDLD